MNPRELANCRSSERPVVALDDGGQRAVEIQVREVLTNAAKEIAVTGVNGPGERFATRKVEGNA